MKKESIINMIDSNARLEKQQLEKLPFSPLLRALLSTAVYIRHTSESLSSAFFAPLRSNFTLSSRILSSLYPCASSPIFLPIAAGFELLKIQRIHYRP